MDRYIYFIELIECVPKIKELSKLTNNITQSKRNSLKSHNHVSQRNDVRLHK